MRILVAEDDAISRTILWRAVENYGHECLTARDGIEAWRMFRDDREVDVVISDLMMPGLDGLGLCRKIRGEESGGPSGGYTYFIFLTALGNRSYLLKGLEAGADDYLSKPLDTAELQVRLISAGRVTDLHRRLAFQNEELERLNRRLFEESRKDPLTNLGNRLRLREDLEGLRKRIGRNGSGFSVVLCDVDYFKAYNDRYGHLAGDEVLRKVAETISGDRRGGDAAYRYGGEEFLVVLSEQPIEVAAAVAERLRTSVEDLRIPHEEGGSSGVVTISAGVASLSSNDLMGTNSVLSDADAALYGAKQAGRNRVVVSPEGSLSP